MTSHNTDTLPLLLDETQLDVTHSIIQPIVITDEERNAASHRGQGRANLVAKNPGIVNFGGQSAKDIEDILRFGPNETNVADFLYLSECKLVTASNTTRNNTSQNTTNGDNTDGEHISLTDIGAQAQQVVINLVRELHRNFCQKNHLDTNCRWTPQHLSQLHQNLNLLTKSEFNRTKRDVLRHLGGPHVFSTVGLNYMYRMILNLPAQNTVPDPVATEVYTAREWRQRYIFGCWAFEYFNRSKIQRESNGINSVTVVTAPGPFSCPMDCYYCPNQPGQPRSYLKTEPAVARANRNKFDPVWQLWERCSVLLLNTGRTGKLEVIILGGTWSGYDESYRTWYIRQLYYAANTFYAPKRRQSVADTESGVHYPYVPNRAPMSLAEEIERNARAANVVKIIGLSIETRPDWITPDEIRLLRRYNVTRVQMGIQHIDNHVLKKINRGCTVEDAERAMQLLLDNGFKVLVHYMPDLPGSDAQKDMEMFQTVFDPSNPRLQADEVKIYPTTVTPYTVIERWFREGKYVPMTENDLSNVLLTAVAHIPPWVRADRIIRDIPTHGKDEHDQNMTYILGGLGGTDRPDYRNVIRGRMREMNAVSWDIREREPGTNPTALAVLDRGEEELVVRSYRAGVDSGTEVFISYESPNEHTIENPKWIYGLCRLRLPDPKRTQAVYTILKSTDGSANLGNGCAIIRQLKAHGQLEPVNYSPYNNQVAAADTPIANGTAVQHRGLGKRLLGYAIITAKQYGYTRLAVIAGVGVRQYYQRLGFTYMDEPSQMLVMDLTDPACTQQLETYFYESRRQNAIETAHRIGGATDEMFNLDELMRRQLQDRVGDNNVGNNLNESTAVLLCYDKWTQCVVTVVFSLLLITLIWLLNNMLTGR